MPDSNAEFSEGKEKNKPQNQPKPGGPLGERKESSSYIEQFGESLRSESLPSEPEISKTGRSKKEKEEPSSYIEKLKQLAESVKARGGALKETGSDILSRLSDFSSQLKAVRGVSELNEMARRLSDMKFEDLTKALESGKEQGASTEEVKRIERELQRRLLDLSGGEIDELNESQYIYYGLTTMPKVRNLGTTDKLKRESGEADRVVRRLISEGKMTQQQLTAVRELPVHDLAKFKEGKSDLIGGLSTNVQKEIYEALSKDQRVWLHQKLERLPWDNLDLSQLQNSLAYREFVNAQIEMLPELAEYARELGFASQAKYLFENGGIEPLIQRSSDMKAAYEVLSKNVYGWEELVPEIESFITRKSLEGTVEAEDKKLADLREKKTLAPSEKEYLEKAAKGIYVYETDGNGVVTFMRPKTNAEKEIDKQVLGKKNSWKLGGFVEWKNREQITAMRDHLVKKAEEKLKERVAEINEHKNKKKDDLTREELDQYDRFQKELEARGELSLEEVGARAKIAAFAAEWLYWRMTGRSALWGEQGGLEKGLGGGYGEQQMFMVIGFQQYALQEAKGSGEAGREMRKIMFGADTLAAFKDNYVPGMAGGTNFNLGLLDVYSQYTGIYPGERDPKVLHNAGFERGYGKHQGEMVRLMDMWTKEAETLTKSGMNSDKAWEKVRSRMSDDEKNWLDEYNNVPIVTLTSESSKKALAAIASGEIQPWSDLTDYFGGDFQGAEKLRGIIVRHDTGFLSDPQAGHAYEAAAVSEGRKRIWQRTKIVKDLLAGTIEFRGQYNHLEHRLNWNSENVDQVLTEARNNDLIVERTKRNLEKELYSKITGRFEKLIPVWGQLMKNPTFHKVVHIYFGKGFEVTAGTAVGAFIDFWKFLYNYLRETSR